jgi:endo-1,3(4)-beta-glucanase
MKKILLVIGAIAAIVGVGAAVFLVYSSGVFSGVKNTPQRSLVNGDALGALPKKDVSGIDTSHLGPGVTPPTNKWFSGFALQADAKPGFAYPNSYRPTNSGFEVGLPQVDVQPNVIMAGHRVGATLAVIGATSYKVTRYDELSVDVTYYDAQQRELAVVTFMAGVPFVPILAKTDVEVRIDMPHTTNASGHITGGEGSQWFGGQQSDGSVAVTRLNTNQFASIYSAGSRDDLDILAPYALNRPMNAAVEYGVTGTKATTHLSVQTANNKPTLMTLLPHQQATNVHKIAGYPSQFGTLQAVEARKISYDTATIPVTDSLDLSAVSEADKTTLRTQLAKDTAATKLDSPDTYFGGKQLQRAAQLLTLAHLLQDDASAKILTSKLRGTFEDWANPQSPRGFYYDTKIQGIVGKQAGFGANEFNDHHFHYGYFLYAAGVLAQHDSSFVQQHGKFIDLLAADIANYKDMETLPLRRNYDPYAGHSWASGAAPFMDGNNQESSSEAINAWTGLTLWARASQNAALEQQASWLLANESASAKRYWMGLAVPGYDHKSVGILWGGKRDWGTWFSADANAIVAIQLLPMTPTMAAVYGGDTATVSRIVSQPGLNVGAQYGAQLLMFKSLAERVSIQDARTLPDTAIDDGSSRAYVMAFVASRQK